MPIFGKLLFVGGLVLCGADADVTKGHGANFLQAGTSLHSHHTALRAEMHQMMAQEDDDVQFTVLAHQSVQGRDPSWRGNLQQSGASAGTASLDDYIKEAEEGLSAALGPRWDAKFIEADADRKTKALLRGISGPRATHAIGRMMNAIGR
mmetsp:Transcript_4866/g.11022  ORF Transcript_4866/g.11022 Transcript_4866/m.11022 type:complete len:150 (-) Transcript_4866:131-580(-)